MAKKRFYDGDYSGPLNDARRQEKKDSMMISEDRSACANLPQDVKYHAWPKSGNYANYDLDDTIGGIDRQIGADSSGMKRNKGGNKW